MQLPAVSMDLAPRATVLSARAVNYAATEDQEATAQQASLIGDANNPHLPGTVDHVTEAELEELANDTTIISTATTATTAGGAVGSPAAAAADRKLQPSGDDASNAQQAAVGIQARQRGNMVREELGTSSSMAKFKSQCVCLF